MIQLLKFLLLLILTLSSCTARETQTNSFDGSDDTLIIDFRKIEGHGLFRIGATPLSFRDTTELKSLLDWFDLHFKYPENLSDSRIGIVSIMINPLRYFDRVTHDSIQLNNSRSENIIGIATGKIANNEVFIVDQNNNRDFRDDSIRSYKEIRSFEEWVCMSNKNLIKCKYVIVKRNETIRDSGWIKIGLWKGTVMKSTCQHMEANFSIDDIHYKLGVVDRNMTSFCFFTPVFSLLGENNVLRDTLLERDLLSLGEFIKLGKSYYKITDFYSGSGTIKLLRIDDFESKVGIQVGAIAPSFKFISIDGDTIYSSRQYKNTNLLIANVSICTSRSFDVFNEIQSEIVDELRLIGINYGRDKELKGIILDVENEFNTEVYKNFRNAYSSYDCYLINKDGRIVDKFSIFDWKSHLNGFIK
jgi:hypothetical protein